MIINQNVEVLKSYCARILSHLFIMNGAWIYIFLCYVALCGSWNMPIGQSSRFSRFQLMESRPLGPYERLLSRKSPNSEVCGLSHGCFIRISRIVAKESILLALACCIHR